MRTDRRAFLRWTAAGWAWLLGWRSAAGWLGWPGAATASDAVAPGLPESALEIHRATRNTRLGALGVRLRASREALQPWKGYPAARRLTLPTPTWVSGRPLFALSRVDAGGFGDRPVTRAELSRLLLLTNGITGRGPGGARRSAPSAGALYAGEVYVAIERVEGVPAGVYYYDVRGHALVPVREGRVLSEVAGALEYAGGARGAALAVLLTNVFARYRVRYANRGYRYALIDSGHIGENLRLAAAELGLREHTVQRWEDDRLNVLLRVDGRAEAVCALHLIGRPVAPGSRSDADSASGSGSNAQPAPSIAEPKRLAERQQAEPAALTLGLSATEAYHEATKLVAVSGGEGGATAPSEKVAAVPSAVVPASSRAEAAAAPETSVHAAIRVRRSARRFEPAALPREQLMRILALARSTPTATAGGPGLELDLEFHLDLVAHRVAGLAPGIYRYAAAARTLAVRRRGELSEELIEACLGQRKSGQAAAALIGVGNLEAASARGGARAYRHLLLEAGAVAQRIYLGAEAQGLAARNLSAYYDDALDALLGLDGRSQVALHLTALGPGD